MKTTSGSNALLAILLWIRCSSGHNLQVLTNILIEIQASPRPLEPLPNGALRFRFSDASCKALHGALSHLNDMNLNPFPSFFNAS